VYFTGNGGPTWMSGDNYIADILGAASVGVPRILVRKPHDEVRFFCTDLAQVAGVVD